MATNAGPLQLPSTRMTKLGPNVFVTGANRGIGLGLVRQLVKCDDVERVFASTRNLDKAVELKTLADESRKIIIVQLDVLSDESINSAVKVIEDTVGDQGLQLLFNNAGVGGIDLTNPCQIDRENLEYVVRVNFIGAVLTLNRAAAEERPSKVVNVSSAIGSNELISKMDILFRPTAYAGSKAALNMATTIFSLTDHAKTVISVAMCPGWVRTELGGPQAPLSVDDSTTAILETVRKLGSNDSGRYINRLGETIPN